MTVTFLDASGKTLDGKAEALDFIVSTDVIAISIGFGSVRNEERAYRDGAFLRGYTQSTKLPPPEGEFGTTYRLVRDGGWPASPQLYVDEQPVVPAQPDLQPLNYSPLAAWALDSTAVGGYQAARLGAGYGLDAPPMSIGADLRVGHTCVYGNILSLADSSKDPDFRFWTSDFTCIIRYAMRAQSEFLVGCTAGTSGFVNSWELRSGSSQQLTYATGANSSTTRSTTAGTLTVGPWRVVSLRRDASRAHVNLGINDTFTDFTGVPAPASVNAGVLHFGGQQIAPFVAGGLADCVLWPSWLTDAQVVAQYKAALGIS